jgi:hypothetical protein
MLGITTRSTAVAAVVAAGALSVSATASASPVTVNLRVEGSTQTLFEGQVSTDAETFATASAPATTSNPNGYPCDFKDNGSNGGYGPSAGTPTTALRDAALASGLVFDAGWSGGSLNDFFVSQVGSDQNTSSQFWGYAANFTTASVGGCQIALAPGNNVLWAYDFFSKSHLLSLSAPASVGTSTPVTVTVTDGQNGQPISGASVGGQLTDAAGHATFTFPTPGMQQLKASRSDSVRSNLAVICVHNGNDGTCGTTTPPVVGTTVTPGSRKATASVAHVLGLSDGLHLAHGYGPRFLRGLVENGGALADVEIRLTRRQAGHCAYFSGRRARFVPIRCGRGFYFSVGDVTNVDYLLPRRLGPGVYQYELKTVDRGGLADTAEYGRNRVLFRVD